MPSIFNHNNNACWGIRRTSYNIFNEPIAFDVNVDKTEFSTASVNQTVNKIDNFHGSSNGYYGYHITKNTEPADYAMDTSNDCNLVTVTANNPEHGVPNQIQNYDHWRRKRSHPKEQEDSFKRVKKEDPKDAVNTTSIQAQDANESALSNNIETYEEDRQVIHIFNHSKEDELELLENYLKQTHGCDFYNLNKSDDF